MKKLFAVILFCLCSLLSSVAAFGQTEEDAGLSSEISSDEASSSAEVQGMENAMDAGSSDMND